MVKKAIKHGRWNKFTTTRGTVGGWVFEGVGNEGFFTSDKDATVKCKKVVCKRLARLLSCIGILNIMCTYLLKLATYGISPDQMRCWFVGLIDFNDYKNNSFIEFALTNLGTN
ncbi:hypothetical protein M0802_012728 [Mischocyttarus mexicanus]|nr:hypothetical protein M0802_012728 [Mischocyttarus mexicanus]